MEQGFISLHRKLLEWEWFTDVNTCHVFIYCLLRANYKPAKWRGQEIKRGEFITSLSNIAADTGLTVRQVRTAINKLKTTHELTHKGQAHYSIITVNNWSEYQMSDTQNDTQMTNKRQTSDKQVTTDNKDNKNNKENNIISLINTEKNKKIDPYINPVINEFKDLHEKIIGKRVYLNYSETNKLTELAADVEDFSSTLPTVLKKLKNLKFNNIGYKPNASWLLKDNHYTEILNGAYDYETREEIVARLEKAELERRKNEKN